MEPSVLHNLDPSSSDRTRSPPSSLPSMEPTSDQIALLQVTSDDSTDTVIPDQHEADIFDSPPHLEELNQTHAPIEDPDLESQEASTPHIDQNCDVQESHSLPVHTASASEEDTLFRPDSSQGAAASNLNLPGSSQDAAVVEAPVLHQDDFSFLYNFDYDQHRKPKRNDIIFYFDIDIRNWAEVRVLSKTKHPNNYNI